MDRRMFDQLDQLERGARDVQPRNDSHAYGRNNSSQYHNDDVYNRQPQQDHQNEATPVDKLALLSVREVEA